MQKILDNFQYILTPPGMGVHTVHTAKEIREKFHQSFYHTVDLEEVKKKWSDSIVNLPQQKEVFIFGIPSDTGGGIQRGANWGPLFLRETIQYSPDVFDIGDVKTIPHLLDDKYLNEETLKICRDENYDGKELPVSPLSIAYETAKILFDSNKKILSLGGDHSVSYPLVKAWLETKKKQGTKVAIIHFDAHTDLMDKRLGIDICFASWAYHMIDLLEKPSHLMQFGIRSSGQDKSFWESKLGVQQYWAQDFRAQGIEKIIDETLNYLKKESIEEVYISFDIDFLDAKYASSTGTPEDNGPSPHEAIALIDAISENLKVTGADLVEVAPFVRSYKTKMESPEPDTTLISSGLILNKLLASLK